MAEEPPLKFGLGDAHQSRLRGLGKVNHACRLPHASHCSFGCTTPRGHRIRGLSREMPNGPLGSTLTSGRIHQETLAQWIILVGRARQQ